MALKIEMKRKLKQETSKGKAKGKDNRGQRGGYGRGVVEKKEEANTLPT